MTSKLTQLDKKQIKSLMKDERWDAMMKFVALKLEQWKGDTIAGQTAFEELRALHKRDGKVEGVNEVFDQLEKQAFED